LLKCDARSVAGCIVQSAILGLEPSTVLGEAYLILFGKVVPG
jgi:recombinational DNA repair protein RecT